MIDTERFITDAELLAAFHAGPVNSDGVPPIAMAQSLRHVAELAISTWISETFSSDPRRVVAGADGLVFCADGTIWIRSVTEHRWIEVEGIPRP